MSSYETEFPVASCRLCSCTEDAPCMKGCVWVFDPGFGDLCSSCMTRVYQATGRLVDGVADQADVVLLRRFTDRTPDGGPVVPLEVQLPGSSSCSVAA